MQVGCPAISRSLSLTFVGDWGQANFHRICCWLCQEFCDRAGPRSRVAIWNVRDGGMESLQLLQDGEVDLCIATPAMLLAEAPSGAGMFASRPMPELRALAVLPQNDRLVLAIDPAFGVGSFAELRQRRPALRIAASVDDGTNFIGYVTQRYMEAHGIDAATLAGWGGQYVTAVRPEQSLARFRDGEVDAVIQEAVMTPLWQDCMRVRSAVALPAEERVLRDLEATRGWRRNVLPAGYWPGLREALPALDFSDFVVMVRSDMPDDVARLLTWCLVETRQNVERYYRHLPADRSPLGYPLDPRAMCRVPLPLHDGAARYYREAGCL